MNSVISEHMCVLFAITKFYVLPDRSLQFFLPVIEISWNAESNRPNYIKGQLQTSWKLTFENGQLPDSVFLSKFGLEMQLQI